MFAALLVPAGRLADHYGGRVVRRAARGAAGGGRLVLIFIVNVPIGLLTLMLGARVLPEIRAQAGARLPDAVSVLALLAAVTLLIFGLVQGPSWGWSSDGVIGLLAGAAVAAAVTARRTLVSPNALIEASLFESREFASASLALFLFFIAFAVFLLITVPFLQDLWHYSALRAGLAIAPGPLVAAGFAINSGRLAGRFGRGAPAAVGALMTACAGGYWLAAAPAHPAYLTGFLPGLIPGGVGAGLTQAPLFAAAGTLAGHRTTTGSAVLNMSRQVGSAVGVAALVALLATSHPGALSQFHRGWRLQILAASGAALSIGLPRLRAVMGRAPAQGPARVDGLPRPAPDR